MSREAALRFECFGGAASVHVRAETAAASHRLAQQARETLLDAHRRLSRFDPDSELSRLNRDPRETVPASRLLVELAAHARRAGELSGGLVDATLVEEIERAGYRESLAEDRAAGASPAAVLEARPAAPSAAADWRRIEVDRGAGTISRPPGVQIDSGGIAKGLLADLLAERLAAQPAFAVNCCGDIRVGGTGGRPRTIRVDDPEGGEPLRELPVVAGGVATSGIGRRAWTDGDGLPCHHLLDPASGRPAFTGVIQATALAPSAFLAEVYAKQALLSGPELAPDRLPGGGVLVLADGSVAETEGERVAPR
ncbi:MAG: FAD:protein FMN transferase [Solirubrobacterales bacterium]